MSTLTCALVLFIAVGVGLWLVSFLIEALRPAPEQPATLRWAPGIPIQYLEAGGNTLRYVTAGTGPVLVLLHTLRTQLDLFEKILPELSRDFTVYALDYPGHGYSDIPKARYDAAFFTDAVEAFLDKLDLRGVTLAGVSIGGSIAMIAAARRNPRVARVIAINPYDYARGRGMARSSLLGWMITQTARVPVIGETVMRLRNSLIMKAVLRGGVADIASISPALMKEMYEAGNRRGHYRAFLSLLRNSPSWETATGEYGRIGVPVLFVWGDGDWARPQERAHDEALVPGAQAVTVAGGGHFLVLDQPATVIAHIREFAA